MKDTKKPTKVYVVQVGSFDESPDDVYIAGVFKNLKDAYKLRNELFLYNQEDEDYEGSEDLKSFNVETSHEFFTILEMDLK